MNKCYFKTEALLLLPHESKLGRLRNSELLAEVNKRLDTGFEELTMRTQLVEDTHSNLPCYAIIPNFEVIPKYETFDEAKNVYKDLSDIHVVSLKGLYEY